MTLVGKAYADYSIKEEAAHPKVVFSAIPTMLEYASAPGHHYSSFKSVEQDPE
jgi:hypothetical protein